MRALILAGPALALGLLAAGSAQARGLVLSGIDREDAAGSPTREELSGLLSYFLDLQIVAEGVDPLAHTLHFSAAAEPAGVWNVELLGADGGNLLGTAKMDLGVENLREQRMTQALKTLLLANGYRIGGRLHVQVQPPTAEISLDTGLRQLPALSGDLTMQEGQYTVRAKAAGHQDGAARVTLTAGSDAVVVLNLTPTRSDAVGSPVFWIAAITGAVLASAAIAGGLAAAFSSSPSSEPTTFCQSVTPNGCAKP